jgi:hypothetical protein
MVWKNTPRTTVSCALTRRIAAVDAAAPFVVSLPICASTRFSSTVPRLNAAGSLRLPLSVIAVA